VLAGALIDGPPGSWPGQMVAATPDGGRQRVREAKAAGWQFIKSYSLLSEPTYLALAETYANPFLFHGYTLYDELARYVDAGLTPQQALLTATVNPGRFLARRDLAGRVGIRQRADLVLLDANPLEDIRAIRGIHAVVANGRLFNREALDALLRDVQDRAHR